jgi:hypothetical protein
MLQNRFLARVGVTLAATLILSGNVWAQSCLDEEGEEQAQLYVDQCLEVSPATRPPCNADNPCQLMRDEIARGCAMLDGDAPEFCGDYE